MKALTEFPSVLNNLAKNLTWTSSLGEAYHNQPADVMAAVQRLRAKAKAAGTLKSTPQLTVVQQSPQTIVIQPANPQVVYVPEYNPAVIYGTPYVTPGYTAGDVAAAGVIGFGAGIAIGALAGGGCCGWGWNSWNCDWHGGAVVYNHNNFYGNSAWHGGYYNGGYHDGYGYHNAYNRITVNNFHGSAKPRQQPGERDDITSCRSRRIVESRRQRIRQIECLQRSGRSLRWPRRLVLEGRQLPWLGQHALRRLLRRPVRWRTSAALAAAASTAVASAVRYPSGPDTMSLLTSNYKLLTCVLAIVLVSCTTAVKPSAERAAPSARTTASQNLRIRV